MTAAIVKPITKDHIVISLSPDYRAVSFALSNGGAEIVILDRNATETTRLNVAPPAEGHTLEVQTFEDSVEITYKGA